MTSQTIQLRASFQPRSDQSFYGLNGRELQDRLLSLGYETIVLSGALLNQFCDGVDLWVENDVMFLVDCYLHLEEILLIQTEYKHNAYLNDGLLITSAKSNGETVEIKFRYCPGLDIANLITYVPTVTANEYVW